jgi:hypothetical protein
MTDQEKVFGAIEDPTTAKILSIILDQINGEPLAAARMIRAFQGAFSIINETTEQLPAKWQELEEHLVNCDLKRAQFTQDLRDFRQNTTGELKAAVEDLKVLEQFFAKLDDNEFLNKANRILELCDKLTKAKRDGTLAMLQKLLTPQL